MIFKRTAELKKGLRTGLLSEGTLKIGLFFKFVMGNLFVLLCFVLVLTIVNTRGNANRNYYSKNLSLNA